jgi:oligopeptide/dipeptide ABC transporter ATP-binding protein
MQRNVLELINLSVIHKTKAGPLRAVDDVSLKLFSGRTLGVVGESGCGKSTLARAVVGLNKPAHGHVVVDGAERDDSMTARRAAARRVQMVFQDPMSSLNPRMTVRKIVEMPLKVHGLGTSAERRAAAEDLMSKVGLGAHHYDKYPNELSGGQRQRVSIATALALKPSLIVCDEAVSALDVSVQAQVLNLLTKLQKDLGISFLFISHDLSVVRYISHDIVVMYLGRVIEYGPAESVWSNRLHPYTRALIASVPELGKRDATQLAGDVPSAANPPSGCSFRTRCPFAKPLCAQERPPLAANGLAHAVACHFAAEIAQSLPAVEPSLEPAL